MPGRVLFLNGSSSSGKTTLTFSLQSVLSESWVSVGVDQWIISAPLRLFGSEEGHRFVEGPRLETGPEFRRIHKAWHRATTTLLDEGVNVIVDEVLLDPELRDDWVEVLAPYDVTWVKVWCDPDVCEERATLRGDRALGMARVQAGYVHEGVRYDTVVDTTSTDSFVLAQQLKARLEP